MDLNRISFTGEEMLNCLLSVTSECFAVLDKGGFFVEANQAFGGLLGIEPEQLKGRSLFELEPEDGGSPLKNSWENIIQQGSAEKNFELVASGGDPLNMQGTFQAHRCGDGDSFFVCLFCKELPFDADKLNLLKLQTKSLAATANAVVITDAEGLIVWANRAFSKYTGYALDEAVGKSPGTLLKSGRHPAKYYEEMWETIRKGDIWQGEIINQRKDGTLYPEEMTITPMFSSAGVITHYIAVKQDVSEKKNLQEMFLRAQRLESVGTLASGVAHDLNNVLSPIVMSADLLMVQTGDEHTREMLMMIKESAKRGAGIIRQLLSFMRGDTDDLVELQVRHLLKELIKIYRETFPRFITIDERLPSNIHPVRGNATHLQQVFTNLMINARDAMFKGGTLFVHLENVFLDEKAAEEIPQARPGRFVRVRFQDEGTGIPEDLQKQIFNSFFTTKSKDLGTGLGLPTALSIIEKHNGFLSMESTVGVGSVFDVYLPVFTGGKNENIPLPVDEVAKGRGEHLLVIDDEESIGFMLKGTLKSLNYKVKVTGGGKEGLDWWMENRDQCDLILLDMMMPGMDGAAVYKELKNHDCEAKILIMSGMVSEEKLQETGVDLKKAFIPKPFTIVDLSRKIRQLLDS